MTVSILGSDVRLKFYAFGQKSVKIKVRMKKEGAKENHADAVACAATSFFIVA